jgi:predicted TIM-barrel fold metal-dependent hydrolase
MLGCQIAFSYCRELRAPFPCDRALQCFGSQFPVAEYFRLRLSDQAFYEAFHTPSLSRYEKLLVTVDEAKKLSG